MAVSDAHSRLADGEEWVVCEIALRRGYASCSFVALSQDEEIGKSRQFRAGLRSTSPAETAEAASCLAGLEQELEAAGWELITEDRPSWYSMRFRRTLVPLSRRIGAYATSVEPEAAAVASVAVSGTPDVAAAAKAEQAEAARLETERMEAGRLEAERAEADRLEAEHLEAERVEAERIEADRLEAERLETERLVAERLEEAKIEAAKIEAERLEAERLEAKRLEAERVEAARLEAERLEAERRAKADAERAAQPLERVEPPPVTAAVASTPEPAELSEPEQPRLDDRLGSYSFALDHDRSIEIRAILHLASKRPPYGHEVQHEPRY